jgi:hypothetical protein
MSSNIYAKNKPTIITSSAVSNISSNNNISIVDTNNDNIIKSDSEWREVVKSGYLLNAINLSTIPDIIQDAIDAAILDAKDQTLSDALIQQLRDDIDNLGDGIYTKTYIDDTITYLEELLIQKASPESVAAIAEAKIAVATADFATTSQVSLLSGRVGESESSITEVRETVNTKDIARAAQITDMEARINDTFAGYSNAIELYVDEDGNTKSQTIETLSTSVGLRIDEIDELIVDKDEEWNAKSLKLITAPDGSITGYSFQDGSGLTSNFTINADNFKISDSTNSYTPFAIVGNELFLNGKVTFSNVEGVESILTIDNVQDAINNNVTYIDGGKIVTNEAFVNNLNATGGITADYINADNFYNKNFYGGYIEGARINGAVIKASYLDLDGELEVLTNYHISVATYNASPSSYSDAIYISADNEYRIPSISSITEYSAAHTLSSIGSSTGRISAYNIANVGNNYKAVKANPVFQNSSSTLLSANILDGSYPASDFIVHLRLGTTVLGTITVYNYAKYNLATAAVSFVSNYASSGNITQNYVWDGTLTETHTYVPRGTTVTKSDIIDISGIPVFGSIKITLITNCYHNPGTSGEEGTSPTLSFINSSLLISTNSYSGTLPFSWSDTSKINIYVASPQPSAVTGYCQVSGIVINNMA